VLSTTKASEGRRYKEFELDELASTDKSVIRDKTISDNQVFENAASYESLDKLNDIDRILAEKQRDSRKFYLIHRIVIVKMKPRRSYCIYTT
jgi:hypothetical protein